jgi:hypothetical protein
LLADVRAMVVQSYADDEAARPLPARH